MLEYLGGLLASKADDMDSRFSKPHDERSEITVTGSDGKGIRHVTMQDVHGIYGNQHIGGVFANDEVHLLDGIHAIEQDIVVPTEQKIFLPVAINAADEYVTFGLQDIHDAFRIFIGCIVGINEQSDAPTFGILHIFCMLLSCCLKIIIPYFTIITLVGRIFYTKLQDKAISYRKEKILLWRIIMKVGKSYGHRRGFP